MGENAKVRWDWHNHEVGKGYQARGVVRQSSISCTSRERIIDMTGSCTESSTKNSGQYDISIEQKRSKKKSRHDVIDASDVTTTHKGGRRPEHCSNDRDGKVNHDYRFNPLMQDFALRLIEVYKMDDA
jgi:hypothetical protein